MTKSNQNHIFIDTNIIIGAYSNDKKYEDNMEGNIQYILANKLKCGIFFTQNTKDYNSYISIAVYNAKEYRVIKQF